MDVTCCTPQAPPAAANVTVVTAKNATFQEAYQFDPQQPGQPPPPVWSLYPNMRMDIKAYPEQTSPLLSFTSAAGQIIVDDPVNRVLHFNVPESVIQAAIQPGYYFYDLIMFDNSNPAIRVPLMYGDFVLTDGITGG